MPDKSDAKIDSTSAVAPSSPTTSDAPVNPPENTTEPNSQPTPNTNSPPPHTDPTTTDAGADSFSQEIIRHLEKTKSGLTEQLVVQNLIKHGSQALQSFDAATALLSQGNSDIQELLNDTRDELLDSYLGAALGRNRIAFVMLRGVMEGLFTALYYSQQLISLNLWASNKNFLMVHEMFASDHEFKLYFKNLFEDEGFKKQCPNTSASNIFDEAAAVYKLLSSHVHKKTTRARLETAQSFELSVERVFRIYFTFLEREEDLTGVSFPTPQTFSNASKPKKGSK
ncbi:hypothetical protein [Corallococcus sp. AB018]|uniref:hypothetical protein n=1 Tax=Corallococcus sp. AB018 TaxID=2316715 RepID=UPI000F894AA6|nr:hypothetical protein [Corallococcus sp. AB018]